MRAGDQVLHLPTGEKWLLAADEERGEVYPLGWPETIAQASDCQLLRAASDTERVAQLLGSASFMVPDVRGLAARRQLQELSQEMGLYE